MRAALSITVETDAAVDAIGDLGLAYERLRLSHGEAFRALERRIERLALGPEKVFAAHDLSLGRIAFAAGVEMADVPRVARALGVI